MAGPFLTANSYLGMVIETTEGTLPTTGTSYWIPVSAPQITPNQMFLRDEALRGSATTVYDQVAGVRHDDFEFKSYLYADTFPVLARSILGSTDTVTGAGPYTHKIKVLNSPSTGSQPPTYSLLDFDGANYFTVTGAQADSLVVTFGAEAAAEATVKYMGNPYTSYTSAPTVFATQSLSSEHLIPAWDTAITIGGTSYSNITTGEISINRKTQAIFTLGTQAPYNLFAGPIEVTGKFTLVVPSNADVFTTGSGAYGLSRAPQALSITLTDPNDTTSGTNHSVNFTCTTAQFHNVKRTRGKEYTEIEVEFTANANATDATTGYSPIQTTFVNGTSTAY
jgi:hypothetical protein